LIKVSSNVDDKNKYNLYRFEQEDDKLNIQRKLNYIDQIT